MTDQTEVLKRLRAGLESKSFTLRDVAKETGIPAVTLHDMLQDGWGKRVFQAFDRIERISVAIERLPNEAA